ncbi:MAG: hypothetical protein L0Y80_00205 [Ignavibacteriae bacterium]|nr:hypothetical protein [Ignavibacteriota bacterium]
MEKTQSLQPLQNGALPHTAVTAERASVAGATPLQRDVLRVLSYFDIFQHPLTAVEIYTFLPSNSTSPGAVEQACHTAPLTDYIKYEDGYFFLTENNQQSVRERLAKEERARRHWAIASLMTSLIKYFPFVRGVFVSGELAKGVASEQGDVDFVIVTENDRLWICRTLLIAFKKLALLNRKKYFCINHLMTEQNFVVSEQSMYTAIELVTLKPLLNPGLLASYQRRNNWTEQFLPNAKITDAHETPSRRPLSQRAFELLFFSKFADWLDTRLMDFWKAVWKKRYPHLSDEKRNEIFHCSRDLSTAYNGDFASKILASYYERLARFELHD